MLVPSSFIQELLARVDVVEVVGRYVSLKKGGANLMGLCPFHNEKSPSFSVSPAKQFYHCFGCGKNGNAISFLMENNGMGFVEAIHELAQQYGLQVPQDEESPQDKAQAAQRLQKQATLTTVLEKACTAYQKYLKNSDHAVAYLKGRGLTGKIAQRFGLGYAPAGWNTLASVFPHYDDPLLVECGLVLENTEVSGNVRRYDRFRDRVMFPIRNVKGECIGFGGRVFGDEKPKYLNSPETAVFSKSRELYGLCEARAAVRERGYALVTEGYMDVVALAQLGFPNAVATLGTACTDDHIHKLFRFTDAVVFSFDGDTAGRHAARKALDVALPLATDTRSVKFLFLPPEHDPDSFIRAHGQEAFERYVSEALPLSRFLLDASREGCDLNYSEGKSRMINNARPLWELLPAGALRHQLLGEIADLSHMSKQELMNAWQEQTSHHYHGTVQNHENDSNSRNGHHRPKTSLKSSTANSRHQPNSRADHAVRILLDNMSALDVLTAEDQALLCSLPPPHGDLFLWLEDQYHEHGVQSWMALREGLRGHDSEALAQKLMTSHTLDAPSDTRETQDELRKLVNRIRIEQIKAEETQVIQESKSDPTALQRYRELQTRRKLLEAGTGVSG